MRLPKLIPRSNSARQYHDLVPRTILRMLALPWIDWEVAGRVARAAMPPGPALPEARAKAFVASLRRTAERAPEPLWEASGLGPATPGPTLVVDRAGWVTSMTGTGRTMLAGVGTPIAPRGKLERSRGQIIGVQTSVALGVIASRVLGQFDPFAPDGRLLLVAPNIAKVESNLQVDPDDFRLWVCLHEETHRLQFHHAPWLAPHLLETMKRVLASGDPQQGLRESLDDLTAVMSLIEGHAEVMMDRAGRSVIRTLPRLRRSFEAHRDAGRSLSAFAGRLIGLDSKRAQYRDGAEFCRALLHHGDLALLNRAFAGPEFLPTVSEIHEPMAWIRRIG